MLLFKKFLYFSLFRLVIKPGSARRVDPGAGRLGGWTGPGLIKDWLGQQLGKTRSTGGSTHNPSESGRDPIFFFKREI